MIELKVSEKGLQALEDGTLDPKAELITLVASKAPGVTPENLLELCNGLIEATGGVEAAINVVRAGNVTFDMMKPN